MMLNDILTVDPGFHTGYAYWKGDKYPVTGSLNLSKGKKVVEPEMKFEDMWGKFEALIKSYNPEICFIESVEHWGGSLKSRVASVRGDLATLSYLVGGYGNICKQHGVVWCLVSAKQWKGQLPNSALVERVKLINGQEYPNEHILCAVGIGLAKMGLLNWKSK